MVCATSGHFGTSRSPPTRNSCASRTAGYAWPRCPRRGVGELLAAQAGRPLPGPVRDAYHRATAGGPLLVHALLDDSTRFAPEIGRPHRRPRLPAGRAVTAAPRRRRARPGGPGAGRARHLAGTVPVGELAGTTPAGTQEAVDVLNSSGLLDGYAFRQPTAAAAVPGGRGRRRARRTGTAGSPTCCTVPARPPSRWPVTSASRDLVPGGLGRRNPARRHRSRHWPRTTWSAAPPTSAWSCATAPTNANATPCRWRWRVPSGAPTRRRPARTWSRCARPRWTAS